MKLLVWQWGRFGAGPKFAAELAAAVSSLPGERGLLSLSTGAEILQGPDAPTNDLPVETYAGAAGFARRWLLSPLGVPGLARDVRALRPDVALCAMPGPLDGLMAAALRRAGVPYLVVVHDADIHPGDGLPFQMALQRRLLRRAAGLVALTGVVASRMHQQDAVGGRPLLRMALPPFRFGPMPPPPRAHGGPLRLLLFGRLLPYKGLDLFAEALDRLGPHPDLQVRVAGRGPESPALDRLRALGARVENRWVPETEVGALLAWSDALVLSHTEASQSGVAAAALAAGRWVVATRVGGLVEQLADEPLALLCTAEPDAIAGAIRQVMGGALPTYAPARDAAEAWLHTAAALLIQVKAEGITP